MIKAFTITILLAFLVNICFSQIGGTDQLRDSLKHKLAIAKDDTSRVLIMADITNAYWTNNFDSISRYGNEALALAQRIRFPRGEVSALNALGVGLQSEGDYPKSLEYLYRGLQIAEKKNYVFETAVCYTWIGLAYWYLEDYAKSIDFYNKSQDLFETIINNPGINNWIVQNIGAIGQSYLDWNQLDSAYHYLSEYYNATLNDQSNHPVALYNLGDYMFKRGNRDTSFNYVRESIEESIINNDYVTQAEAYAVLSRFFKVLQNPDSAIYYAKKGLAAAASLRAYNPGVYKNNRLLALEYEQLNEEQIKKENRLRQYGFIAGLAIMLFIAFILYRNNLQKRKANILLQHQKEEIDKQKKEAQIEAALERVRTRTMAMQRSDELSETAAVLFQQFKGLGQQVLQIAIGIPNETIGVIENSVTDWGGSGAAVNQSFNLSINEPIVIKKAYTAWKEQKKSLIVDLTGNELEDWLRYRNAMSGVTVYSQDTQGRRVITCAFFSKGLISLTTPELPTPESVQTLERFAGVFDLTYTRFLDLQKAEAQAREAQIETSLERVRSKTMAMHNSNDVGETVATMFAEFEHLGIHTNRCGILIFDDENTAEVWTARSTPAGNAKLIIGKLDLDAHKLIRSVYNAWQAKESFHQYDLLDEDLKNYYTALNNAKFYPTQFELNALPVKEFHSDFPFTDGAVFSFTNEPLAEEHANIMKRFASVFGQTYRRYLDLQKAEAQAREAQIEAALEKVRAKAMTMHNSNDLSITASIVFTELRKLGISPVRSGVTLVNGETRRAQVYSATTAPDGDTLALIGWIDMSGNPMLEDMFQAWLKKEDYFWVLSGEKLKSYYEYVSKGLTIPFPQDLSEGRKEYGYHIMISIGALYAWSETSYNDSEIKILKRFATIVDLTFRRYLELQTSEASAREAVKQAALDRIRADIASMRTVNDLDRITPLIWTELSILGVPFIRCGVFIMDNEHELIHTFLSTPEGKAIAAFLLSFDTPGGNISAAIQHWRSKENYISYWSRDEIESFADSLVQQGAFSTRAQYLSTLPDEGFYVHFLPFLQGMLYVANTTQLPAEQIKLIQSIADAFSTAYARYEDFNRLEAAKQQVEKTLTDLKQAQTQLIQSEKMASLGELTAGIAHEIQNPLNFVNNFSEVNDELIGELVNEVDKGNIDDAKAIAADIKQNLEKINQHGKRADAIVKGMLQHSRATTGKKEQTDINALADEYLRLSYHGMRAKDKSFNVTIETDFENSIGKINVVPQDLGRVLLNLYNNAFYAVTEKRKTAGNDYEPTIIVGTKKINDKIEIIVRDNGNGISQKVLDKIFQPFFTTKPTGQGTGLGLSLAYDIVKTHGGEIKVETKEGEGSGFIIQLPILYAA